MLPTITEHQARQHGMFGPVYHGTYSDMSQLRADGFKVFIGPAQTGDIRHGYDTNNYGGTGIPAPIHHLGFGVYFTTVKTIAQQFAGGRGGQRLGPYYLDVPRLATINFGSPSNMMKWWIGSGFSPSLAKVDRVTATVHLTQQLASRYDAVWYKGKGLRKLLDGDQICVYDPARIYLLDNAAAGDWEIGSTVIRKADGMRGTIRSIRDVTGILAQYPFAHTWLRPETRFTLTVTWRRGGTQMQVQDPDVTPAPPRGRT